MSDQFAVAYLGLYVDQYGREKHKLWLDLITVEPYEDVENVISDQIAQLKDFQHFTRIETTKRYLGIN